MGKFFNRLHKLRMVLVALLTAALLVAPLAMLSPAQVEAVGEPLPGTVERAVTFLYYPAAEVANGTQYSDAPLVVGSGLDVTRISDWHSADIFVTTDFSGTTAILTVTVQFSPDQRNWADAGYTYISQGGPVTAVVTSLAEQPYQLVLTEDGTDYLRVPMAGEYMRFKLEKSGLVTHTVEATVQATLRND